MSLLRKFFKKESRTTEASIPEFTDRVVGEREGFRPLQTTLSSPFFGIIPATMDYRYECLSCHNINTIGTVVMVQEIERTPNPDIFGKAAKSFRYHIDRLHSPSLYRCSNCLVENIEFNRIAVMREAEYTPD